MLTGVTYEKQMKFWFRGSTCEITPSEEWYQSTTRVLAHLPYSTSRNHSADDVHFWPHFKAKQSFPRVNKRKANSMMVWTAYLCFLMLGRRVGKIYSYSHLTQADEIDKDTFSTINSLAYFHWMPSLCQVPGIHRWTRLYKILALRVCILL